MTDPDLTFRYRTRCFRYRTRRGERALVASSAAEDGSAHAEEQD